MNLMAFESMRAAFQPYGVIKATWSCRGRAAKSFSLLPASLLGVGTIPARPTSGS